MNKKQKIMLIRILTAAALLAVLHVLPVTGWMRFGLYLIPYLIAGYDILRKALKGIQNRQVFDENFLMAVATVGAIALALYERSGDYTEAIAVMLFYQIGEWFQSYAVGRSRRNISELMDIRPDYANVEQDGKLEQVDPDEVSIGTVIVVQPGEKVPIDGTVVEGASTLNTAALTGESLPREVREGDEIISGCVNMTGLLKIRTTREFGESTVSKILDLVENASSRKSKSEDFISRFARIYTPAVCCAALALVSIDGAEKLSARESDAVMGQLVCFVANQWKKYFDIPGSQIVCRLTGTTFVVGCLDMDGGQLAEQMRNIYAEMPHECVTSMGMMKRVPFTLSVAVAGLDELDSAANCWQRLYAICDERLRGIQISGGNKIC